MEEILLAGREILDKAVSLPFVEMLDPASLYLRFGVVFLGNGNDDVFQLDRFFLAFFGRYVGEIAVLVHISDHVVERTGAGRLAFFLAFLLFEAFGLLFLFVFSFPNR